MKNICLFFVICGLFMVQGCCNYKTKDRQIASILAFIQNIHTYAEGTVDIKKAINEKYIDHNWEQRGEKLQLGNGEKYVYIKDVTVDTETKSKKYIVMLKTSDAYTCKTLLRGPWSMYLDEIKINDIKILGGDSSVSEKILDEQCDTKDTRIVFMFH